MNIKEVLLKAQTILRNNKIQAPELDCLVLLEHTLKKDRAFLFANPLDRLTPSQQRKFFTLIKRRASQEPVAYIIEKKEFFGLEFFVNKNVLIPRPETEWLVEKGADFLKTCLSSPLSEINVLDLGTGSGCIIISLAKRFFYTNRITFVASDISKKALDIARKNFRVIAPNHRISFVRSDLFENCRLHKRYDLILANLPYVPIERKTSLGKSILFEPSHAIYSEKKGKAIISSFLNQAVSFLRRDGRLILEVDDENAKDIADLAKKNYSKVEIELDNSRLNRYIIIGK